MSEDWKYQLTIIISVIRNLEPIYVIWLHALALKVRDLFFFFHSTLFTSLHSDSLPHYPYFPLLSPLPTPLPPSLFLTAIQNCLPKMARSSSILNLWTRMRHSLKASTWSTTPRSRALQCSYTMPPSSLPFPCSSLEGTYPWGRMETRTPLQWMTGLSSKLHHK